eukprot:TRINITY_DN6257_c0_g1_i1.p1 TRINITY_DN6257_c0_g1~~TRINITY_DN6257_c0_g1_i1.p1  ORF type:complete len:784 (+),score=171.63 TRINITY_DN6257_c0_g1_i1:128-2479(+)
MVEMSEDTPLKNEEAKNEVEEIDTEAIRALAKRPGGVVGVSKGTLPGELVKGKMEKEDVERAVETAGEILAKFEYHIHGSTFNVDKKRTLQKLIQTADSILKEGVKIQCVEACFVALLLTQKVTALTRFSMSFESKTPQAKTYRHLVLGIKYDGRYGSLGISRNPGLMTKSLQFENLHDLVVDFIEHYKKDEHTVVALTLGKPVDVCLNATVHWNFFTTSLDDLEACKDDLSRFEKRLNTDSWTEPIRKTSASPLRVTSLSPRRAASPMSKKATPVKRTPSKMRSTSRPTPAKRTPSKLKEKVSTPPIKPSPAPIPASAPHVEGLVTSPPPIKKQQFLATAPKAPAPRVHSKTRTKRVPSVPPAKCVPLPQTLREETEKTEGLQERGRTHTRPLLEKSTPQPKPEETKPVVKEEAQQDTVKMTPQIRPATAPVKAPVEPATVPKALQPVGTPLQQTQVRPLKPEASQQPVVVVSSHRIKLVHQEERAGRIDIMETEEGNRQFKQMLMKAEREGLAELGGSARRCNIAVEAEEMWKKVKTKKEFKKDVEFTRLQVKEYLEEQARLRKEGFVRRDPANEVTSAPLLPLDVSLPNLQRATIALLCRATSSWALKGVPFETISQRHVFIHKQEKDQVHSLGWYCSSLAKRWSRKPSTVNLHQTGSTRCEVKLVLRRCVTLLSVAVITGCEWVGMENAAPASVITCTSIPGSFDEGAPSLHHIDLCSQVKHKGSHPITIQLGSAATKAISLQSIHLFVTEALTEQGILTSSCSETGAGCDNCFDDNLL